MQLLVSVMRRVDDYRVIQIRERKDLRINVESSSVIERYVQALLRLKRRHKVAAVMLASTLVCLERTETYGSQLPQS